MNSKATFVKGSITNRELLELIFASYKIDYIYHIAAYAAEGLSHFIRNFNYTNNLIGSVNLINLAVRYRVKCFVFTSSIAVYGAARTPMTEEMIPQPEDPYGIAKYAVELDLKAAHKQFGLNYIIFRPHNVYGERQNVGDPYRNVIGIFMKQILDCKPCTVFGDGTQTRAFSHISDVAPMIATAPFCVKAYNEIFNIGADVPYSVNELLGQIQLFMEAPDFEVVYLPKRKEVLHAFSDHSKLKKIAGTTSKMSLSIGLTKMIEWLKIAGVRSGKPFGAVEITEGLPESWGKLL